MADELKRGLWTCPNCGHENPREANICKNCGTPKDRDSDDNRDSEDLFFNGQ